MISRLIGRWSLAAISTANALFSVYDHNWSAVLGWTIAAIGWSYYATHR